MATAVETPLMTTEELLALPDDGIERWLIEGKLYENRPTDDGEPGGEPMTVRNRFHSETLISIGTCLKNWRDRQPEPRGKVLGGEAGVRLRRDPDTTVGVDVVYVSAEVAAVQTDESTIVDGVPLLAVEILSPSDKVQGIRAKTRSYLAAGVPLVWIVDPYDRSVTIHRPNLRPTFANEEQELTGEAVLPGFRVLVGDLFR